MVTLVVYDGVVGLQYLVFEEEEGEDRKGDEFICQCMLVFLL